MICERCGERPASFHITTVAGEERAEHNLCAECMAKLSQQMPALAISNLTGMLSGFLQAIKANGKADEGPDLKCPSCGLTYSAFRKLGSLGCAGCYRAFREPLRELMERVHGHSQHVGRIPDGEPDELPVRFRMERLRAELTQAIAREEYEAAAELRDRIRAMGAEAGEGEPLG